MALPIRVKKKPVTVDAFRFLRYSDALDIFRWAEGLVFYVPRGADHDLRYSHEKDRSTTHTLDNAVEFLVVKTRDAFARVDIGDYVIRGVNGEYYPIGKAEFDKTFDLPEED